MSFGEPVDVLSIGWEGRFDALARLDDFLRTHAACRCVGFLGFDVRDAVEPLEPARSPAPGEAAMPSLWIAAYPTWTESLPDWLTEGGDSEVARTLAVPRAPRASHLERVQKTVDAIRDGEVFQANITQPVDAQWSEDPRLLFRRLCASSPAPFAAYVDTGDFQILSSSPEEFLFREGRSIRSRPIKGTRPRLVSDLVEDNNMREQLWRSEKDRAELAMIVDLVRNDFGKVAQPMSVDVGSFPEIASYSHVHHLYATVRATLREGMTAGDILRATFPCGSITGAPKLRAMEIIEQLEASRRGVYTGAIGWFGPGDTMHLNVAIRTMVRQRNGSVRFDVGGGVTARSSPDAEYQECLDKAAGMLDALAANLDVGGCGG